MLHYTLPIGTKKPGIRFLHYVKTLTSLFFLLLLFPLISSCASSGVSREAAVNMDRGERNAKGFLNVGDNGIADAYQNSSQTTKGALIGGTAGAIAGAFSSVGVIPGTATGLLLGASYGKFIDAHTTLQDQLINRGAKVVELGDQILIVLPSDRIFQASSAKIKAQAYSTINLAAKYINSYYKMLVRISVYTGMGASKNQDLALSQQQAHNIERALLLNGIDARVLYAEGYGQARFVTTNALDDGYNENYRVEITLEKLGDSGSEQFV